jgi:putative transcription antitermination factor YqgF
MRYLGIDYGEKRVGIAISDVDATIAFPKTVLNNSTDLVVEIDKLCKEFGVDVIVVGESKDYKGEDNKINPKIIAFKRDLTSVVKLPIFLEPEFMSSMQVEKTFGKTDMLDASAASIILQTFMNKEKSRQERKREELEKSKIESKITYDDFSKVQMKVGKILQADVILGSDKLLKLLVDFAETEPRQIVSGIAKYFSEPSILINKKVVFVANLAPREIMGLMSNGMILAAKSGEAFTLMEVPDTIETGTLLG